MTKNTILKGVGVALVTPFTAKGAIDFQALEKLIDYNINNGVDYLVALGTTGETPTLSTEEQHQILDFILTIANKRIPIVGGFGGNATHKIIQSIQNYDCHSLTAILSNSPYYNKPSQQGIYLHYKAIAEAAPVPIILYNVPGRTSSNVSSNTSIRLAQDCPNIIAIKEASGNLVQCMEIVKNNKRPDFAVLSGDDVLTLPMLSFGMNGVISVIANAFPRTFSEMVHAALNGNFNIAQSLHFSLLEIMDLLFVDGNPAGVKAALNILGICGDDTRLPLVKATTTTYKRLEQAIYSLKAQEKLVHLEKNTSI